MYESACTHLPNGFTILFLVSFALGHTEGQGLKVVLSIHPFPFCSPFESDVSGVGGSGPLPITTATTAATATATDALLPMSVSKGG